VASRLTEHLRRLSALLSEASMTLEVMAAELDARPERAPAPAPAAPPAPAPTPPTLRAATVELPPERDVPWDDIVERAIELLGKEPRRTWKPAELCRAVRDSGIAIESLQGLHFGIMPRLRQRGAIREGSGGFLASELLAKSPEAAPQPEPRPSAPEPKPKPPRELPWAQMISAAANVLHQDPDRAWGQAELVRAVRDFGVPLDNLQGIHFGLTGRLIGLGIADADKDGKLRLSSLVGGRDTAPGTAAAAARAEEPRDEVDALAEEIDACEIVLVRMPVEQRTAQVAVWAGRARDLQDRWKDGAVSNERRGALRRVFGRLTRITRELQCEWIDALTPGWSAPWPVYIAWQDALLSGEQAPLLTEEQQALARARLRGLFLPNRHVSAREATPVIADAAEVLDAGDDDLRAARERFGEVRRAVPPAVRKAAPDSVPQVKAPEAVLALTRGKRAVIVGGTGTREEHRVKLQAVLEVAELDWATSERGATGAFARVEERVKHGTYDLVIFLAGYTSHKSVPLLRACKARGVPLVYVPRGYSAAQVVAAIEEQLAQRGATEPA